MSSIKKNLFIWLLLGLTLLWAIAGTAIYLSVSTSVSISVRDIPLERDIVPSISSPSHKIVLLFATNKPSKL